ncbi:MAG: hypothetical protein QF389_06355 [Planctomycetota bacterium]|nr:hypothetical protein [Planctomycetota bacterium]
MSPKVNPRFLLIALLLPLGACSSGSDDGDVGGDATNTTLYWSDSNGDDGQPVQTGWNQDVEGEQMGWGPPPPDSPDSAS